MSPLLPSCRPEPRPTCLTVPPSSVPLRPWVPPAASTSFQPVRSTAAAVVLSRVSSSCPRSVPTRVGECGDDEHVSGGGRGRLGRGSGQRRIRADHEVLGPGGQLDLVARGADDVVQVAALELVRVEQEQLVVPVHRVDPQPGVETVEVGGAGGQEGHQPAEQLRPDHQLLGGGEVDDRGGAVRVGRRPRPDARPGGPAGAGDLAQVGPQRGRQRRVEGRIRQARFQQDRVHRPVELRVVQEHCGAVGSGGFVRVDEADQPPVRVDPVGQHVPAELVLVSRAHLVGQVVEERHVGEPEPAQQLVAGRVRTGQLLVRLGEVGLQRVDGLQPYRDPPRIQVRRPP